MRFSRLLVLAVLLAAAPALHEAVARSGTPSSIESTPIVPVARSAVTLGSLPLYFEPNRGQASAQARFLARSGNVDVYLAESGAVLDLRGSKPTVPHALLDGSRESHASPWVPEWLAISANAVDDTADQPVQAVALRYRLAGANPHPQIEGIDALPGRSNYLIGNDARQWHTDIPQYRAVRYRDVLPGVNVVYYGNGRQLEFDVEVAPGVDLADVRLRVEGADALVLDGSGNLRVSTALGELTQHKPVVYQVIGGERRELRGGYVLRPLGHEVAFNVPDYDRRFALVLDPTLVWTSQVGGSGNDANNSVAVDANGNWYFAGYSDSAVTNFPTTPGAYQTANLGGADAFVRKVSNDGTAVLYSTLLGGTGNDYGTGVGVDASGNAHVAGYTYSTNFPIKAVALQTMSPGTPAGFVATLNATGSDLVYSTYLGGSTTTYARDIAVDAAGNAFVTGETTALNLPTSATAFQPSSAGQYGAFVFKFDSAGNRVFGTYIIDDYLGFGGDHGSKIAIDPQGNAYVVGYTDSHFGGTYNGVAYTQLGPGGSTDMFVARLNHTGQWLDWVSHIGGSQTDKGTAIAVNAGQQIAVTGWSASSDLPPVFTNNDDWGWIGQLDQTGTQVLDASWLGAPGVATFPQAIVWDNGQLLVAGAAQKPSALPPTNAIAGLDCAAQCGGNSSYGGLVAFLTTGPLTLQSLTRVLGATGFDTRFFGAALDPGSATGRMAVAGSSNGTFPGTTANPSLATGKAAPGTNGIATANDTGPGAAAAGLDTRAGTLAPVVEKYLTPESVESGQTFSLQIVLRNPNTSVSITNLHVVDVLPGCLALAGGGYGGGCSGSGSLPKVTFASQAQAVDIKSNGALGPGESCTIYVNVKAVGAGGICNNATSAITSDQGIGDSAEASVRITPNFCNAVSTGACSAMNLSNASCWSGNTPPTNTCDAEIVPCASECDINNDQPGDQKINRLTLDGAASITGGTLSLGGGLSLPNPVNVTVGPPINAAAGTLDIKVVSPAAQLVTNEIRLFQNYAYFEGQGTTSVDGSITGEGQVNILGGNVTFAATPTFTGPLNVFGGTLTANVPVQEKTFLDGLGVLRGIGPFAAIEQRGGVFYPGVGTTPADVDVGDLTLVSKAILGFGPGNATHSSVNATGSVLLSGMTLQLNFASEPAVNATFSNLITSPGGNISGCPYLVVAAQPNLVLTAQCGPTAVGAKVFSNERVFVGNFQF